MVSEHFYTVALQLPVSAIFIDFEDTDSLKEVHWLSMETCRKPYHLLNTEQ